MLFVKLAKAKEGTTSKQTIARRLEYHYPDNVHVVGEYWLTGKTSVITIFEADSPAAGMEMVTAWDDLFDISIYPAVTAEEGLKLAKEMFAKRALPV